MTRPGMPDFKGPRLWPGAVVVVLGVLMVSLAFASRSDRLAEVTGAMDPRGDSVLVDLAPADGFLAAHRRVEDAPALLGGPLRVTVTQSRGGAFVALPDLRPLDVAAFGTPEHPRSFAGTPIIYGVPTAMRAVRGGEYTTLDRPSPFGQAHATVSAARLELTMYDSTATDAARSADAVQLRATWNDEDGNRYTVLCCDRIAAHGVEYPTFGGVVTNHLLHGFTRLGTALMPTEFAYAAFWGTGSIKKNGRLLDEGRPIHGMLTEYVRTEQYDLATDAEVDPTRRHCHLMVPPVAVDTMAAHYVPDPVPTGYRMPNGEALPFWHVMFPGIDVRADRG